MTKLSRYISGIVGNAILLVLFLVVSLDMVFALVDQLYDLRGEYDFLQAVYYVWLTVPGSIIEYVPLSALIGCLAGMGVLASSSELTVMRASGLSVARLASYAARPVILIIIFSMLVSEFVAPVTDKWAKTHRDLKRFGTDHSLVSSGGFWHREGNTFMHFNVVQPGGVIHGVITLTFDEANNLITAQTAKRASFQSDQWLLEEVTESHFGERNVNSSSRHTLKWQTALTPDTLAILVNEPEQLAPSGLYRYTQYLGEQGIDSAAYRLAFWQKCLQPLAVLSLVLVALSFVFGPLRSATMGFRVFVGVVVGIAFQFAQNLLGPSSIIYGFSPLYAVLVPIALCFIAGAFLLVRAR